jgi:hypothetical protein
MGLPAAEGGERPRRGHGGEATGREARAGRYPVATLSRLRWVSGDHITLVLGLERFSSLCSCHHVHYSGGIKGVSRSLRSGRGSPLCSPIPRIFANGSWPPWTRPKGHKKRSPSGSASLRDGSARYSRSATAPARSPPGPAAEAGSLLSKGTWPMPSRARSATPPTPPCRSCARRPASRAA